MRMEATPGSVGLVGVGYEGLTVGELVARLATLSVTRLVDVRLNPISRKPELSKTALGQEFAAAGILYEHRRELGNPKINGAGFAAKGRQRADARERYARLLAGAEASDALVRSLRPEAGSGSLCCVSRPSRTVVTVIWCWRRRSASAAGGLKLMRRRPAWSQGGQCRRLRRAGVDPLDGRARPRR
ncbi:DUF488 family protein [Actinoplanes sp. CA-131856]